MAAERLPMRKIKEFLRLRATNHSNRSIARSVGISHNTVWLYRHRVHPAGLAWPLLSELTDRALEAELFPKAPPLPSADPFRFNLTTHFGGS